MFLSVLFSLPLAPLEFHWTSIDRRSRTTALSTVKERIFPYIGGAEVNRNPYQSHERYVINFGQMTLGEAEQWPDLIEIVRREVKSQRDGDKRASYKKYWWQFAEKRVALYAKLADLDRCLVNSRVSKHLLFAFQPTDRIFAETLVVHVLDRFTGFACLQSRIHDCWARLFSSSMKSDLRYSITDCLEPFPFPNPEPGTILPSLEEVGKTLHEHRATYLQETGQGLTDMANLLKDPRCDDPKVQQIRELHLEVDQAVLTAYGWDDISVPPFESPADGSGAQTFQRFEDEILDRLFVLNQERAQAESRAASRGTGKAKSITRKSEGQGELFGPE